MITILPETTKNPITLIGERAGICWGTDITSPAKNFKRGIECLDANHGRTLEFVNIETVIEDYSARVIREWYTHIGGAPTRLQASTRYVNYGEFDYYTPASIQDNEHAKIQYDECMKEIQKAYANLQRLHVPKEDIANILPLGMMTKIMDKRNLRNLIDMAHQRMCTRAYAEYRDLFDELCDALANYSNEWAFIVAKYFVPKCEVTGFCTETYSCGHMPKK